jgi:replicative DNA helicase
MLWPYPHGGEGDWMLTALPDLPTFREPPHNLDAEQSLLGAILVNNDALERVASFLRGEHFYDALHGKLFEACERQIRAGRRATPVTLKTEFATAEAVGELSVPQYLGRLAVNATTITNAEDYGRTVFDLAARRKIIEAGQAMVATAYDAPIDFAPDKIIEAAAIELTSLAERGRSGSTLVPASEAMRRVIDSAAEAYQRDGCMAGLSTGLADLDALLSGLVTDNLIIVAGRPGMGKSALAAGVALHNAERFYETRDSAKPEGCPVAVFSLEMSAEELFARFLAQKSGVSAQRLRAGDFSDSDFDHLLEKAQQSLAELPIYVEEAGQLTIGQILSRARRLKRQRNIGLIVVDYLQLVGNGNPRATRYDVVSDVSRGLKAMAKELHVPVVAVAQLSRQTEAREWKRPQLSDLKESGSIEQDADIVALLYRDDYYVEKRKPQDSAPAVERVAWEQELSAARGKATLYLDKARQGPTGIVDLAFNGELTKFSNLARGHQASEVLR